MPKMPDARITLLPLATMHFEDAFMLASDIFAAGSTLHVALGVGRDDYRDYLRPGFFAMLADGLSIGAIDQNTGRLVGVLIAADFHKSVLGETPALAQPIDPRLQPIKALSATLEGVYLRQRPSKPGETALVDMAAIAPSARGNGLYRRLRHYFARHAGRLGYHYVIGELSSSATQKVVLEDLGHRQCAAIAFADFQYDGGFPFQSITAPSHIILAEGALSSAS